MSRPIRITVRTLRRHSPLHRLGLTAARTVLGVRPRRNVLFIVLPRRGYSSHEWPFVIVSSLAARSLVSFIKPSLFG